MPTIIKLTFDKGVIDTYSDTEDHIIMDQIEAQVLNQLVTEPVKTVEAAKKLVAADAGCAVDDLDNEEVLDDGRTITRSHSRSVDNPQSGTLKWEITDEDDFSTIYLVNY